MVKLHLPAGLAVLAAAGLAQAQTQEPPATPEFYRTHFEDILPISLDTTQIAVQALDRGPELDAALAQLGLDASAIVHHPVPHWDYLQLPGALMNRDGVLSAVYFLAGTGLAEFVSPVFQDKFGPLHPTRHLHVQFEERTSYDVRNDVVTALDGTEVENDWNLTPGLYRFATPFVNGFEVYELAHQTHAREDVVFAESDWVMTLEKHGIPNDPQFNECWGLHNTGQFGGVADMDMNGPEAWDYTEGDFNIGVIVLDDGTDLSHGDITLGAANDYTGSGTGGNPGNVCDNHGTAVAGCVAATINNAIGVVGSAPGCALMTAKTSISNVPCNGAGTFQLSWVANAINWSKTSKGRVTNNSNGFSPSSTVTSAYQTSKAAGAVHFSSAGNDGSSSIGYPANLGAVNAVMAITRTGVRASFSTTGSGVAFAAPGQAIRTTDRVGSAGYNGGNFTTIDGTSFASPYAAGAAALVFSVDPSLTAQECEGFIENTAKDRGASGYDNTYGWGIPDMEAALIAAGATPGGNPLVYCTAKTTSTGNLAAISWNNPPSWAGANFELNCFSGLPLKNGIPFWGDQPNGIPFLGGHLCVLPPTTRGTLFQFDNFGFYTLPIPIDIFEVGTTRYYQFWFRDPAHPDGTNVGLTEGLRVTFEP